MKNGTGQNTSKYWIIRINGVGINEVQLYSTCNEQKLCVWDIKNHRSAAVRGGWGGHHPLPGSDSVDIYLITMKTFFKKVLTILDHPYVHTSYYLTIPLTWHVCIQMYITRNKYFCDQSYSEPNSVMISFLSSALFLTHLLRCTG